MKQVRMIVVLLLCMLMTSLLGCTTGSQATDESTTELITEAPTDTMGPIVAEEADYSIEEIDGRHYLIFDDTETYEISSQYNGRFYIRFGSLKELHDTVVEGRLDDSQKRRVATWGTEDNTDRVPVCDFTHLYTPTLPEGAFSGSVRWQGGMYAFSLKTNEKSLGFLCVLYDVSEYHAVFQETYMNFYEEETATSTEQVEDRDAEVTYYQDGSMKRVRYTLQRGDKTVVVDETYSASETVPQSVYLYGSEHDTYWLVTLKTLSERPSEDWILSFGLEPYTK